MSVPALAADTPRTLRLDFFHTGSATEERFSLDRLVLEPLPWPGNPAQPIDDTNLGKYLFEVIDRASNRVLYSRGFASIYGEWETTGEAKQVTRTFHESLRFPMPAAPVQVRRQEARRAERVSRGVVHAGRSGGHVHRSLAGAEPGCGDPAREERRLSRARWTC